MANIVELRDMSDDKLEEMLENAREEMFNLRFQQASARLENYARLKNVRREVAQFETVLNMRKLAVETAVALVPELSKFLSGKVWTATARYVYEDAAYQVNFVDENGKELAAAVVDLNQKQPQGRRARALKAAKMPVTSYEIAG
jgi:large subunit ribosomal protein L29